MSDLRVGKAPSLDDLAALAEAAFQALPEGFRKLTGDVVFRVDDFASSASRIRSA
jgi:predicted Zn-dependent protease with MMP-like domain